MTRQDAEVPLCTWDLHLVNLLAHERAIRRHDFEQELRG
jgi:hypothetical protein